MRANSVLGRLVTVAFLAVIVLGAVYAGLRGGWRRWSASWISYLYLVLIMVTGIVAQEVLPYQFVDGNGLFYLQTALFPLLLAYLLYRVAVWDRVRGLLAAIMPMAALWNFFQEFVPLEPKALAYAWTFGLAFAASAAILRARRFRKALILALLVPVLAGLPFTYLGVYMGGTLPYSEPGPSTAEVFRQYFPFLAAMLSIALGPQLAVHLRRIGQQSGAGGRMFNRLALGGILLITFGVLLHWNGLINSGFRNLPDLSVLAFASGAILYGLGFALTAWAALSTDQLESRGAVVRMAALFILLPGVPLAIYQAVPGMGLWQYLGVGTGVLAIVWALAATWLVARWDQLA